MNIDLRIRCILWGCWTDQYGACPKCGCALYDADFVQEGKLAWLQQFWWRLRHGICLFTTRHCAVCNKRMWFTWSSPCCSEKCNDEYIPF